MIDNIIELDTFMRLACFYSCIRPALLSFDLQAAFPSIIWTYIFAVRSAMGIPSAAIAFIKALYADARHIIRFKGKRVDAFTIENGILQGCPMSGALFAIVLDPFIRRLLLRIHRPMQLYGDMIAAFLDDIGMVVGELFKVLPSILLEFDLLGKAAGVHLNISKTVIVPLWRGSHVDILRELIRLIPAAAGITVRGWAKILGVFMGPDSGDMLWIKPTNKVLLRMRAVKAWRLGLPMTIIKVNQLAISCWSFVAQFGMPARIALFKERNMHQAIVGGPRGSMTSAFLGSLNEYGFPAGLRLLEPMCLAASWRAATFTSNVFDSMSQLIDQAHDAALDSGIDEQWLISREWVLNGTSITQAMKNAKARVEAIARVPQLSDTGSSRAVQSKVYKLILPVVRKESPQQVLRRKFAKHFSDDELELALRRVPIVIRAVMKLKYPYITSGLVKT